MWCACMHTSLAQARPRGLHLPRLGLSNSILSCEHEVVKVNSLAVMIDIKGLLPITPEVLAIGSSTGAASIEVSRMLGAASGLC